MGLFDALRGSAPQMPQITPQMMQQAQQQAQQAMSQLQADPAGILKKVGLNIPPGMTDPRQMVQHIMQSGQLPQNQMQQVQQVIVQMMGRR